MGAFVVRSEKLRGARLGGYEIVRLIGHGATASVFEATHVALGKQVAIKVLHEHLASDEQLQSRFVREGKVAARLRHPNTVDVLDVGVESGIPYLVMEMLTGGDLRALLTDVHVLSVEHALGFLLPIASALAQAHDLGVIHRDLKPANIFLARDLRGDVIPKLVDFGLSKIASGESTSSLTATELVAGTVLYMAPEQTLGVRHSSPASDQYSLAAILYEALTGHAPFTADGVYALLERIRTDIVRPPSHHNPRIPEELDQVLLRALHRDPAKRFSSVRAFARALLPFAGAETVRALERDFLDRASARTPAAVSRPSIHKVTAEAETRVEQPSSPKISQPPPEPSVPSPVAEASVEPRVEAAPSASAIRAVAPLPCPAGTSPFLIKGMSYRGFMFLISKVVPGGVDAFCEALTDESLRAFARQTFFATGRYDILPLLPLYATLARLLDVPFDKLVRDTSAAQARYDAHTVFRATMATTSATVESIAQRAPRFGSQYYSFGKLTGSVPEPNVLELTTEGMPSYVIPWYLPMHESYTEEWMRLLGGDDVRAISHEASLEGMHQGFSLVTMRVKYRWRG